MTQLCNLVIGHSDFMDCAYATYTGIGWETWSLPDLAWGWGYETFVYQYNGWPHLNIWLSRIWSISIGDEQCLKMKWGPIFSWPLTVMPCTVLKLMHQVLSEFLRFVAVGSSSNWYGLWCPAHCTVSLPLLCSIFLAGFGLGALSCLAWIFHNFRSAFHWTSSHPPASTPSNSHFAGSRLSAYLHEFPRHSGNHS